LSFVSNHNNNRFITVNHRHYCSKNYKEPLENREIEGSGERIGGFFELDFFFNNSTVFSNNDHDRKLLFCHSQHCHRKSLEVCDKKFLDFSKNSSKKATHFFYWYDVAQLAI